MTRAFAAIFTALLFTASPAVADDWPQWMGPQRDGVWRESGITKDFPAGGPRVKWSAPLAGGYAGAAVAGGRVFVMDYLTNGRFKNNPSGRSNLEGKERVHCLDQQTGETLWVHQYDRPYAISYPAGPRCTPAVDTPADGPARVYTLGAEGDLKCLNAADGSVVWHVDIQKEFGVPSPIWGFAAHPLVDGDLVYTTVGGQNNGVVAFDKHTGKKKWGALSAKDAGYCPASIIQTGGTRQLIAWTPEEIAGLDPATGMVYWKHPLRPDYGMSIAMPRRAGNLLFAPGYGQSALINLSAEAPTADVLWRTPGKRSLYCSNSTPVISGGLAFGCDIESGTLRAIDLSDGSQVWSTTEPVGGDRRRRHATAFLTELADQDRHLLWNDQGDLLFAALTPAGCDIQAKAHVLEPTGEAFGKLVVWTPPAFADRTAYLRNDNKIVAVDLAE